MGYPFPIVNAKWSLVFWFFVTSSRRLRTALCLVYNNNNKYCREYQWRANLYRGYLAICHTEEQHLSIVEKVVECASALCIREWKRLPPIVTHIHLPLLQAAQQVCSGV